MERDLRLDIHVALVSLVLSFVACSGGGGSTTPSALTTPTPPPTATPSAGPSLEAISIDARSPAPAAGGAAKVLTLKLDRVTSDPHFSPDSKNIYFIADDDGTQNRSRWSGPLAEFGHLGLLPLAIELVFVLRGLQVWSGLKYILRPVHATNSPAPRSRCRHRRQLWEQSELH